MKIFINYRRQTDEDNLVFAIANSLMREFGVENVFFDKQVIKAGSEFPGEIDKALENCCIFIPIIGKEWLRIMKKRQALEEPDYVSNEIEHALEKGVFVLPILLDNTTMPSEKDLPQKLSKLSRINAVNISSDPKQLPRDVRLLIAELNDIFSRSPGRSRCSKILNIKKPGWIIGLTASIIVTVFAVIYFINDNVEQKPVINIKVRNGKEVVDIDGNIYKIVTIGTQIWIAENLKTTKFNDGSDIPLVTDTKIWSGLSTPAYCWYNNDISNKDTFGALYNGYSVITSKICPIGWHVPTDKEWYILENYLDPSISDPNAILWRGIDCGTKLKEGGLSGFDAKMGGAKILPPDFRDFGNIKEMGYFFTSTDDGLNHLWARTLTTYPDNHRLYPGNKVNRLKNSKNVGYSIRCIKDK